MFKPKKARANRTTVPDGGALHQMVETNGTLDFLWMYLHDQGSVYPSIQRSNLTWTDKAMKMNSLEQVQGSVLYSQPTQQSADRRHDLISVSYNVLSLHEEGRNDLHSFVGKAALLREQLDDQGVHVAGLQEARTKEGLMVSANYARFCSGATDRGLYGVELWLSTKHQIAPGCKFRIDKCVVVAKDPTYIIVHHKGAADFVFAVAHAPHTGHDDHLRSRWWSQLSQDLAKVPPKAELVLLIDANTTIVDSVDDRIGMLGDRKSNSNTPYFCHLLHQFDLFFC